MKLEAKTSDEIAIHNNTVKGVKDYYGKILQTKEDLQTSACCATDSIAPHLREILKFVHPKVQERFYGCGSPIPSELNGKTVLDLGCGSGRDCFILSKLVGETGRVIGVDMTVEQIDVAKKFLPYHMEQFGFRNPNIQFLQGYIEDLESLDIKNDSIDVVISNCVLNLSPQKERVFSEIFRVLKPGGELYFSDVFAGRRIPKALSIDPVLVGECLGGALYIEDFRRILTQLDCADYRITSKTKITLNSPHVERKAGMIDFYSMTIRAFKLELEDRCEDYGQIAYYLGSIPEAPNRFNLDDHHIFEIGRPMAVCGNTASMLSKTRYGPHFRVIGDCSVHYGLFDCSPAFAEAPKGLGCC